MPQKFFRVAAIAPSLNVADCEYNTDRIIELCNELYNQGVEMAVFPELSITGYTCADLFHTQALQEGTLRALERLAHATDGMKMIVWVGASLRHHSTLYNCAIAVADGNILAVIPKTYLPNYNEFYEKRWWASGHGVNDEIDLGPRLGVVPFGAATLLHTPGGVTVAAEICEDMWSPIPPSSIASLHGAQIIANLSASDDLVGKYECLMRIIKSQSVRCVAGYVYASAGYGESTTDLTYDGKCVIAENGEILKHSERWLRDSHYCIADVDLQLLKRDRMHINTFQDCATNHRAPFRIIETPDTRRPGRYRILHPFSATPFVPTEVTELERSATEAVNIQISALARRLSFTHTTKAVIGISGGLDSTLALLVTVGAFDSLGLDREGIIGVTMPGFGTTDRTYNNALTLMSTLGITTREISIVPAVNQHFSDIGHDPAKRDVTYENAQARQRTLLLMDIANEVNGLVIGTGDLSELALGWATYNGDHMSMYGVNAGIPKTLVRYLVGWFASHSKNEAEKTALLDVLDTPISPELIPADDKGNITQKTEDLVGPYELHDFFIFHMLRYGRSPQEIFTIAKQTFEDRYTPEVILHWLRTFTRRFFSQQFKRSCMPDGPKVCTVSLSPRGDLRMPSDASVRVWLNEIDSIDPNA